jgi:hypothetical protein
MFNSPDVGLEAGATGKTFAVPGRRVRLQALEASMVSQPSLRLRVACLLAGLAGCAPIGFDEQEFSLRHDAKADALEVLIVYDSIQSVAAEQERLREGLRFADVVSKGRREFMILDWPLHFDLEELLARARPEEETPPDPWQAWSRELLTALRGTEVVDSGYCRGKADRVSLHQELRFTGVAKLVAVFDRALHLWVEDSTAAGEFESETPVFDARTRELWTLAAKEQRAWLSLKDGLLVVDLPMTEACASRLLGEFIVNASRNESSAAGLAGLFSHLESLRIADERAVLRWKLAGPTLTFPRQKGLEYDPALAEDLRAAKALPDPLPSRAEIEARFRARSTQDR